MPLVLNTHSYRDPVRIFVETILAEAGYSRLAPELQAEAVAALTTEAQKRIGLDLLEAIDRVSLAQFHSLFDGGATNEELAAFFALRVPDLEARLRRSLAGFGTECLRMAKELRDLPPDI